MIEMVIFSASVSTGMSPHIRPDGREIETTASGRRFDRRQFLGLFGTTAVAGLAGCVGDLPGPLDDSTVNGRDEDSDLAAIDFGSHGMVDVRYLVPEDMSSLAVQQFVDGNGVPVCTVAGRPGGGYEGTIAFYREADGAGGWTVSDEGGDEEADGESGYSFVATRDAIEANIEVGAFGPSNVNLWIGIWPHGA